MLRTLALAAAGLLYAPLVMPQGRPQPESAKSSYEAVDKARVVLAEGAADKDPEIRRQAAIAFSLSSSKDPSFVFLETLLTDKDAMCREAAITSVGQLREPKLADLLRPALQDDVPEVMFAAARALYQLGDEDGKRALIEILMKEEKAESNFLRGKLREVARRLKTPKSALLFATEQGIGFAPVPGLGEGYSALTAIINDAELSPRAAALLALGKDRTTDSIEMVERAFADDDWSMKAAAIQITAAWNERSYRAFLVPLLEDSNRKVRFRAAAVYLRLVNYSGEIVPEQ